MTDNKVLNDLNSEAGINSKLVIISVCQGNCTCRFCISISNPQWLSLNEEVFEKKLLQVSVDILPVASGDVEFTGYQLVALGGYKCFVGVDKIAPNCLKGITYRGCYNRLFLVSGPGRIVAF